MVRMRPDGVSEQQSHVKRRRLIRVDDEESLDPDAGSASAREHGAVAVGPRMRAKARLQELEPLAPGLSPSNRCVPGPERPVYARARGAGASNLPESVFRPPAELGAGVGVGVGLLAWGADAAPAAQARRKSEDTRRKTAAARAAQGQLLREVTAQEPTAQAAASASEEAAQTESALEAAAQAASALDAAVQGPAVHPNTTSVTSASRRADGTGAAAESGGAAAAAERADRAWQHGACDEQQAPREEPPPSPADAPGRPSPLARMGSPPAAPSAEQLVESGAKPL